MNSLTILCPSAHRCTIKVTPTKQLNEVLREACQELGYDFNRHDLAHHGKPLDGSASYRLSGLSNNATLELVPSKLDKSVARPVDVAVQFGNGRCVLKVKNNLSLMEILDEAAKEHRDISISESSDGVPMCTYMNQSIKGVLQLQKTTLMALGIYSANAKIVIRYSQVKLTEEEKAALVDKFNKDEAERAENLKKYAIKKQETEKRNELIRKRDQEYDEERKRLEAVRLAEEEAKQKVLEEEVSSTGRDTSSQETSSASTSVTSTETESSSTTVTSPPASVSNPRIAYLQNMLQLAESGAFVPSDIEQDPFPLRDFKFPTTSSPSPAQPQAKKARVASKPEASTPRSCERNAIFFKQESALTEKEQTEDDTFFEVGVEDVKAMQRSLTQSVKAETERALVSDKFVAEKNRERKQSAYKHSVVRFMLPNRAHLQGNFISTEPTSVLYTFVRENVDVAEGRSFSLLLPVANKIYDSTDEDIIKKGIAPKATVIVRIESGASAEIKDLVTEVSQSEADERSKQWLSQNTNFEPFNTIIPDSGVQMRPVARGNEAGGVSYQNVPHTQKKGIPKWLQKK